MWNELALWIHQEPEVANRIATAGQAVWRRNNSEDSLRLRAEHELAKRKAAVGIVARRMRLVAWSPLLQSAGAQ